VLAEQVYPTRSARHKLRIRSEALAEGLDNMFSRIHTFIYGFFFPIKSEKRAGIRFTVLGQAMQVLPDFLADFLPAVLAGCVAEFIIIHLDAELPEDCIFPENYNDEIEIEMACPVVALELGAPG
jgi:hypothetical protein